MCRKNGGLSILCRDSAVSGTSGLPMGPSPGLAFPSAILLLKNDRLLLKNDRKDGE